MYFNSIQFAIFLPIVFALYWMLSGKHRIQNLFIVFASYVFYSWWDWRFLSLIFTSTIIDYFVGLGLTVQKNSRIRKILLWTSIILNLGFLGLFKYYNFFQESLINMFSVFGIDLNARSLKVILPVGISFYTFQTLSYSIDIYRRKLQPTKDFIAFVAFVSFFPQLVAGPIERSTNLLPQFLKRRSFDYGNAVNGLRQILWGLFKKILIADRCAEHANNIFDNYTDYNGSTLLLGTFFFAFQIYGDFSGYSDIAIGTARLFGINLMKNFDFPYFSRDIAEFWRRWHISLSTWFRDYLYIPIGGSRNGTLKSIRNIFIVFIVSGFWHGANWTFLIWGGYHALCFIPLLLMKRNRNNLDIVASDKLLPSLRDIMNILSTFLLTSIAWVFFRAENVEHALGYLHRILSINLFSIPEIRPHYLGFIIVLFTTIEWFGRKHEFAIEGIRDIRCKSVRWLTYIILILIIYFHGYYSESIEFIYFQF